ncbi:MAG: hypothetical protein LBB68_05285 [Treponema sp.]|jgi:LDH2 family malate/lactate/ureidoglycolate dehydrogenase|nr:hypothetical protein [Treponema sp.]
MANQFFSINPKTLEEYYLHDQPKAEGVERIYVPGEIENRSKEQKLKDGLSIHEQVIDDLIAHGRGAGLSAERTAFLKACPVK